MFHCKTLSNQPVSKNCTSRCSAYELHNHHHHKCSAWRWQLALYPGLLTPAFVACSTNTGEGLVNWSCAVTYMDMWRSGTFLEKPQASALPIANTDCRTTERSTSGSLGDISWVQKAALQLYRRNVLLLHTSRYVTPRDSVLPGFPCISTASDKH